MVHDLAEDQRQCPPCQGDLQRIGEEVSERLEYVPASLVVIQEACQKYACAKGCTVVTAEKPTAPIDKSLPGPGLLSATWRSATGDHLPLHRQEEIFRRQGVDLPRQIRRQNPEKVLDRTWERGPAASTFRRKIRRPR